jgi:small subunit ribosomal protein S29
VAHWFKHVQESNLSATRDGLVDLPFAGAKFLAHLKSLNPATFSTLTTTRDYEWTKRESTPRGSSLAQLADHGIQRIKFSNDVVVALAEELKANAKLGNCKLMVVVGAVNALWVGDSNYEKPERVKTKKVYYDVKDFTLAQAILPLLSSDWVSWSTETVSSM